MLGRPSKDEYFMGFARHAATRSKDSTKVGACLVGPSGEVRLTGYNGPPIKVADTPTRFERPYKYLYASHAEANVIAFAARQGIRTEGCTLYVTHHPCAACTRTIIQAGIREVVYGPGTFLALADEVGAATDMFNEAGVRVRAYAAIDRLALAEEELKRLRELLDSRPAINAEMPEKYVEWSRRVFRSDAEAIAEEKFVRVYEQRGNGMSSHKWVRSTLGHGETMCAYCGMTNREAKVLGKLDTCEAASDAESQISDKVIADIVAERRRQIEEEGFTPEHDDKHTQFELSRAAAFYALYTAGNAMPGSERYTFLSTACNVWPPEWDRKWRKPKNARRNLVKAAALLFAEIERLDRAEIAKSA